MLIRGITHFATHGYEARRVESPVSGEPVWRIATPGGVRLRGEYDTADAVLEAIYNHMGPPLFRPDEEDWSKADVFEFVAEPGETVTVHASGRVERRQDNQ